MSRLPYCFSVIALLGSLTSCAVGPDSDRLVAPAEALPAVGAAGTLLSNVIVYSKGVVGGYELATTNPAGTQGQFLTTDVWGRALLDVSPDGRLVSWVYTGHPFKTISVSAPDGSNARMLPANTFGFEPALFSPDGKELLYVGHVLTPRGAEWRLFRLDLATWVSRQLIPETGQVDDQRAADWSPDGREVVFHGLKGLERVRIDGTGRTPIPTQGHTCWETRWSPNGLRIACLAIDPSTHISTIITFSPTGRELFEVISGQVGGIEWSPNGRALVFSMDVSGYSQIFRIQANGRELKQITSGFSNNSGPVWAPVLIVP